MKNPSDPTAEAAVIAAILTSPDTLPIVQEILPGAECFFVAESQALFRAIMAVRMSGRKVDQVVVAHELVRMGDIKHFGGKAEALALMKNLVDDYGVGAFEDQAKIVRDCWLRRQTVVALREVAMEAQALDAPVQAALSRLLTEVNMLSSMADYKPAVHIGKAVDVVLEHLMDAKKEASDGGGLPGLTTGWGEVDAFFRLVPGRLYFLAARPGDGKTTALMNMAEASARGAGERQGKGRGGAYVQSLEMSAVELAQRTLYSRANVNMVSAEAGLTTDDQDIRIDREADALKAASILIDDSADLTFAQIRARIMVEHQKRGIEVAFVDHLHEVAKRKSYPGERFTSIDHLAEVVVGLANLAKELNIPVVVMVQMNREIEKRRKGARPQLSDLKGAGKIEERAYVVVFLHPRRDKAEGQDVPTDFIVAKNRTGVTGDIPMIFEKDRGRFVPQVDAGADAPTFESKSWTEVERKEADGNAKQGSGTA